MLGQGPVLLLNGTNHGHDVRLEPPYGSIGIHTGDYDWSPVGLQTARTSLIVATQEGLADLELHVGRVSRRINVLRAIGISHVDIVGHVECGTGGRSLLKPDLELVVLLIKDNRHFVGR